MGPKRKKTKPNPEQATQAPTQESNESDTATPADQGELRHEHGPESLADVSIANDAAAKQSPTTTTTSSWYSSAWRSKASPSAAQLAKESISVAQGATSESSSEATSRPPNSVSKSIRGSRKSIPLAAEASRIHATSDASDKSRPRFASEENPKGTETAQEEGKVVIEEARLPPDPTNPMDVEGVEDKKQTTGGGTWFGWWSRPDGYGSDAEKQRSSKKMKLDNAQEEARSTPLPGTPIAEPADPLKQNAREFEGVGAAETSTIVRDNKQPEISANQTSSRSWFGLWSTTQNQQVATEEQAKDSKTTPASNVPDIAVSAEPTNVEEVAKTSVSSTSAHKEEADRERSKVSGWAFWSSDRTKDPVPTPGGTQKQVGELAVADTPSQDSPEAAQFNQQPEDAQHPTKLDPKRTSSLLRPKRGRSEKSKELDPSPTPSDLSTAPTPAASTPTSETPPSRDDSQAPPPKKAKVQQRPNLVLPAFQSSFPPAPNPGYIERLTHYLAQTLRLPGSQTPIPPQHVFISPSPTKIKRAVALGVHGFFPGALVQRVLGQPTGTSIRFANYAATAIKSWCQEHQPDVKDVEVEQVALEGEGYIADRVSTLWKLLLNWLSHIRSADFILVACHSQGVPVAVMLVAKLIQLGCLGKDARVGVCAMAGINLGPFLEYKSRLFGGSALELFDFCDSSSAVSRAYAESIDVCLRHGVRVTFVGSIDDQLVSLESALYAPLSHPYVARAVFIDGRLHAPNFLTHLVVFALKLRNLGLSDHGLIRELSAPLAGTLVGGEGHSRVYDDPEVFKLAIAFAMETTDFTPASSASLNDLQSARPTTPNRRASLGGVTPSSASPALANNLRRGSLSSPQSSQSGVAPIISPYEPPPNSSNANPFYLPWAVRGMLEEPLVKSEMRGEVDGLVQEFENWRPQSKVLKDVRWRLEGVRSML